MSVESLRVLDKSKMYVLLGSLAEHWRSATAVGEEASLPDSLASASNIVWTGMGGSAIGGNLIQTALGGDLRVPFVVNRDYALPRFVGEETLVIAVSYSGDTEETLSAFEQARRQTARIVCVTSGGELARRARENGLPLLIIPGGMMPRCGVVFLFVPLLLELARLGYADAQGVRAAHAETEQVIAACVAECCEQPGSAFALAQRLHGALPVIYAPAYLEGVAMRWRGQFAENAKTLSFYHVFPEMNHNEIEGWRLPQDVLAKAHVVFLRDPGESPRVRQRIEVTRDLIAPRAGRVAEVASRGESLLARMFSLVVVGDFVSYYLALLNGVDPTPVDRIAELKDALAATSEQEQRPH